MHAWLAWLGVHAVPSAAFHDVDLYRYWMYLGLDAGQWPVLDSVWVYPAGALVPMLLPALGTTTSTAGYAIGWCALVTVLDAVAFATLLSSGGRSLPAATKPTTWGPAPRRLVAAWWWLAFLLLLGPIAMGRLDAVVVPLTMLALLHAARSRHADRWAAALLTAAAWVKVAPGALLLPLVAAARRPLRDVVVPAAAVCAVVVGGVAAGGGLSRIAGFLGVQGDRGLQVESVTATPWMIVAAVRDDVAVVLNEQLVTYEVRGPGVAAAASVLDALLPLAVAAVAVTAWVARRRGAASAALLPGALVLTLVLVVVNKVGSPQFVTWLAAPVVVLLAAGPAWGRGAPGPGRRLRGVPAVAALALVTAALTQAVFPWGYLPLLEGDPVIAWLLAARNVALVVLLVQACLLLRAALRPPHDGPPLDGPGRGGTADGRADLDGHGPRRAPTADDGGGAPQPS